MSRSSPICPITPPPPSLRVRVELGSGRAIRIIGDDCEFAGRSVIIKLLLQNRPWGGVDKTPIFDSAAGGFVYVYGGP
jgi:hypothetical protein